jgi:hypothetical protein
MFEDDALPTMGSVDADPVVEVAPEAIADIPNQAFWIFVHLLIAIGSWMGMFILISLFHPSYVPVPITTALSFSLPFIVGNIFTRFKPNDMGPALWLVGIIWFLSVTLWVLDLPTGPNSCFHCDTSQKLLLTFVSFTEDSGLIDGQGRLVGTWPTLAMVGYALGSHFALRGRSRRWDKDDDEA